MKSMGPEAKVRLEWAKRDLKEARRKIAPGAARRELAATMREREKAAFMQLNEAPWRLAEAVQREYDEQTAADLERERKDMERRCHELQLASLQPVALHRSAGGYVFWCPRRLMQGPWQRPT